MTQICEMCDARESNETKLVSWEMQYLHFTDADTDEKLETQMMTCDKCKLLSPLQYLEKLEERGLH